MVQAGQASPTTILLEGLKDSANDAVWREFDARYRPILFAVARRLGLSEDDAAEVTQDGLTRFVEHYQAGKYDRQRGRVQTWLVAIFKNCIGELNRKRARRRELRGESAILCLPSEPEAIRIWQEEQRKHILDQSLAELRNGSRFDAKTIGVFELHVVRGKNANEVARLLCIQVREVYSAKHRVAKRLREILARWEVLFTEE